MKNKKSICCNDDMFGGCQCLNCGADGRELKDISKYNQKRFPLTDSEIKANELKMLFGMLFMVAVFLTAIYFSI